MFLDSNPKSERNPLKKQTRALWLFDTGFSLSLSLSLSLSEIVPQLWSLSTSGDVSLLINPFKSTGTMLFRELDVPRRGSTTLDEISIFLK